ncbi:uncharacterized protein CMC5_082130 [Chondromyces crocatus]|uniref:DUF998 domain-containing protein n=2 Tax=Chondromyces crocatus TaxID=52 RepID=A0A0K1ESR4_CHOCO|nr:uncharacterized protein CMC5_082130 [Chondromyces crocatus]
MQTRGLAWVLLSGVLGTGALLGSAMALYPGGTWLDPQAPGHDFWRNFFCDLTQPVGLNGMSNRGAVLGQVGMLGLVFAFVPFWWLLPRLFPEAASLGRGVRWAGLVSVVGLVAVPLLPSLRFGLLHTAAVFTACVPAFVAAGCAVVGLRRWPWLRGLGAVTLLSAVVDAGLYARGMLLRGPTIVLLPALQKVAALGLFGWMVGVALSALRLREREP